MNECFATRYFSVPCISCHFRLVDAWFIELSSSTYNTRDIDTQDYGTSIRAYYSNAIKQLGAKRRVCRRAYTAVRVVHRHPTRRFFAA